MPVAMRRLFIGRVRRLHGARSVQPFDAVRGWGQAWCLVYPACDKGCWSRLVSVWCAMLRYCGYAHCPLAGGSPRRLALGPSSAAGCAACTTRWGRGAGRGGVKGYGLVRQVTDKWCIRSCSKPVEGLGLESVVQPLTSAQKRVRACGCRATAAGRKL